MMNKSRVAGSLRKVIYFGSLSVLFSTPVAAIDVDDVQIQDFNAIDLPSIGLIDDFTANRVPVRRVFEGGPHIFKKVVTYVRPQTTVSEDFVDLPGAGTRVKLGPGQRSLFNVQFSAESRCNENDGRGEPNWCRVRILVDAVEAYPQASAFPSDTYAFDSTDNGSETSASWEGHSMDRHICIVNTTNTTREIPVQVQWAVTNWGGGSAPNFWLDDWSLTIEGTKGCREVKSHK